MNTEQIAALLREGDSLPGDHVAFQCHCAAADNAGSTMTEKGLSQDGDEFLEVYYATLQGNTTLPEYAECREWYAARGVRG